MNLRELLLGDLHARVMCEVMCEPERTVARRSPRSG